MVSTWFSSRFAVSSWAWSDSAASVSAGLAGSALMRFGSLATAGVSMRRRVGEPLPVVCRLPTPRMPASTRPARSSSRFRAWVPAEWWPPRATISRCEARAWDTKVRHGGSSRGGAAAGA